MREPDQGSRLFKQSVPPLDSSVSASYRLSDTGGVVADVGAFALSVGAVRYACPVVDPPVPDDKRLFLLLRKLGLDDEPAYTFIQELQIMAAANLIARFEAKLDAMRSELTTMRWLLGFGFAALIAAAIAQLFRSAS